MYDKIPMGDSYKTCELHGKPFPNNMVDTRKTKVSRVYVESKEEIEGKTVTLNLFIGNSENEGFDACTQCLAEKITNLLSANGDIVAWKNVSWHEVEKQRQDGSGTYKRNEKTVMSIPEITEKIRAEKKKG